jgi:hypothetical protein
MTYVDAIGWRVIRVGRDDSCAHPASHPSCNTLPSHGDRDTFRLHLSLVASLSLTLSSPWLRCASSRTRETLWLKRQQWGRRRNYSYTRSLVLLYLLSLLKTINEDGSGMLWFIDGEARSLKFSDDGLSKVEDFYVIRATGA